jgi:hypothetical protein
MSPQNFYLSGLNASHTALQATYLLDATLPSSPNATIEFNANLSDLNEIFLLHTDSDITADNSPNDLMFFFDSDKFITKYGSPIKGAVTINPIQSVSDVLSVDFVKYVGSNMFSGLSDTPKPVPAVGILSNEKIMNDDIDTNLAINIAASATKCDAFDTATPSGSTLTRVLADVAWTMPTGMSKPVGGLYGLGPSTTSPDPENLTEMLVAQLLKTPTQTTRLEGLSGENKIVPFPFEVNDKIIMEIAMTPNANNKTNDNQAIPSRLYQIAMTVVNSD